MPKNSKYEYALELLRTFKPMMFKIAFGILKSNADAEDAVQDTITNLIKNFEKIPVIPPEERAFYFSAVTENVCKDKLRKKKRHPVENIDKFYELASDYSVEKETDRKLLLDDVKSALKELSNKDYYLLTLYYFEELSPKDVAAKMNIPEKNIYKYIERARKRLVKILNERGIYYDL